MKYFIKNGNDKSIRYDQTKNAIEAIIRKIKLEVLNDIKKELPVKFHPILNKKYGYLESCGMSAISCLLEGIGALKISDYPALMNYMGISTIQMDDWGMCYINDPKNDDIFYHGDFMDNRLIYMLQRYISRIFGVHTIMYNKNNLLTWHNAIEHVKSGDGILICLKNHGHYLAIVGYDDLQKSFLISDSWAKRPGNKKGGWHELITQLEWDTNTIPEKLILRAIDE